MSNRFYMLCTRETVGSNASFHCHNGNGYSSNIDRAHVYTQEEAQRCWDYGREIDQPICADGGDALSYRRLIQSFEPGTKLYRHAQPVPVVEREPIAWLNDAYLARGVIDGEAGSEDAGPGYIPVYREAGPQPATVVPDAATAIRACLSEFPESARDIVEECADIAENACRAAMLAAAPQSPGSEPATVPGEWIPVSEQMPPSRHEVLVGRWWGEKPRWCCKWATYIPGHPDAQSIGWLIPGASWTPTHWMPLPAAPQEPKP